MKTHYRHPKKIFVGEVEEDVEVGGLDEGGPAGLPSASVKEVMIKGVNIERLSLKQIRFVNRMQASSNNPKWCVRLNLVASKLKRNSMPKDELVNLWIDGMRSYLHSKNQVHKNFAQDVASEGGRHAHLYYRDSDGRETLVGVYKVTFQVSYQ